MKRLQRGPDQTDYVLVLFILSRFVSPPRCGNPQIELPRTAIGRSALRACDLDLLRQALSIAWRATTHRRVGLFLQAFNAAVVFISSGLTFAALSVTPWHHCAILVAAFGISVLAGITRGVLGI